MRKQFVNSLIKLAQIDKDIILITGDVGYSYFEKFIEKFPAQFINAGIAEQNMMGIAAGLALSGKKPYVYSMIPFVLMRCYEQLRNDVCYHNANVTLIGVKGSVHYKFLGFTHNIVDDEDLQILKPLPNIKTYCPSSPAQVKNIIKQTYLDKRPIYIRI